MHVVDASAYELQHLENNTQKEAFLSSLNIWQAAEDLRQSEKPKPDVKSRSKASLGKEQALQSPQKSLCLKEAQSLTPSGGSTLKHAFRR
ncbi:uncharacterized protein LOC143497300 [Brachyhypopomus gauderio]|uniref:uncharacterized protein LOC143497300 n=1 Tax=Brachyhypopomus gauderio TaxID=698409 RepID=UPI00404168EB